MFPVSLDQQGLAPSLISSSPLTPPPTLSPPPLPDCSTFSSSLLSLPRLLLFLSSHRYHFFSILPPQSLSSLLFLTLLPQIFSSSLSSFLSLILFSSSPLPLLFYLSSSTLLFSFSPLRHPPTPNLLLFLYLSFPSFLLPPSSPPFSPSSYFHLLLFLFSLLLILIPPLSFSPSFLFLTLLLPIFSSFSISCSPSSSSSSSASNLPSFSFFAPPPSSSSSLHPLLASFSLLRPIFVSPFPLVSSVPFNFSPSAFTDPPLPPTPRHFSSSSSSLSFAFLPLHPSSSTLLLFLTLLLPVFSSIHPSLGSGLVSCCYGSGMLMRELISRLH